jgi:hypothetical protein
MLDSEPSIGSTETTGSTQTAVDTAKPGNLRAAMAESIAEGVRGISECTPERQDEIATSIFARILRKINDVLPGVL